MTPWAERLLEVELEELVGGLRPPDLRERVTAALALERVRLRRRRWAVLTLAVLLAGLAAWLGVRHFGGARGPKEEPRPTDPFERLAPAEREGLRGLLTAFDVSEEELPGAPEPEAVMLRLKLAKEAESDLRAWVERSDDAARAAEPTLLGYARRSGRADVGRRAVDVLARNPSPAALAFVLDAAARDPDLLSDDGWLRLAERDVPQALARVEALASASERTYDQVFPAAFLALRGSASGRAALRWVFDQGDLVQRSPDRWLLAAVALERLGEAGTWRQALAGVRTFAEGLLDGSPLGLAQARWVALRAAFYDQRLRDASARSVSGVLAEAQRFEERAAGTLADAAAVRASLDRLEAAAR